MKPNLLPTVSLVCLCLGVIFNPLPTYAQKDHFATAIYQLHQQGVAMDIPVDAGFKPRNPSVGQDWLPYLTSMYSANYKTEIRLAFIPEKDNAPLSSLPQVQVSKILANLQNNEIESIITGLTLEKESLDALGADWGQVFFFQPKSQFAGSFEHIKVQALYKEEVGTTLLFFLFNKSSTILDLLEGMLYFEK